MSHLSFHNGNQSKCAQCSPVIIEWDTSFLHIFSHKLKFNIKAFYFFHETLNFKLQKMLLHYCRTSLDNIHVKLRSIASVSFTLIHMWTISSKFHVQKENLLDKANCWVCTPFQEKKRINSSAVLKTILSGKTKCKKSNSKKKLW